MKKIIALFLLSTLLSGCATYNVAHMRETKKGNLSEIFSNSKEEVYAAVKSALAETDLIIRKENFERGEILATPNRLTVKPPYYRTKKPLLNESPLLF